MPKQSKISQPRVPSQYAALKRILRTMGVGTTDLDYTNSLGTDSLGELRIGYGWQEGQTRETSPQDEFRIDTRMPKITPHAGGKYVLRYQQGEMTLAEDEFLETFPKMVKVVECLPDDAVLLRVSRQQNTELMYNWKVPDQGMRPRRVTLKPDDDAVTVRYYYSSRPHGMVVGSQLRAPLSRLDRVRDALQGNGVIHIWPKLMAEWLDSIPEDAFGGEPMPDLQLTAKWEVGENHGSDLQHLELHTEGGETMYIGDSYPNGVRVITSAFSTEGTEPQSSSLHCWARWLQSDKGQKFMLMMPTEASLLAEKQQKLAADCPEVTEMTTSLDLV